MGGNGMTVNEAIKLLAYGTAYEIKGAYSGKIYHKSYMNSSKNLDKYANMEVTDEPFYTDMRIRGSESNRWCIPVIGIWMHDYDLCRK
jgi:hypothetical protein